jgi:aspartate/methionine/tyrosine aminotransferase
MADDVAFADALLAETGVVVLPGSGFGAAGRGHVRVALTLPDPAFLEALDQLERFVRQRG